MSPVRLPLALSVALLGVALQFSAAANPPVTPPDLRQLSCDLDGDGRPERIELRPQRDPALRVYRGGRLLWQGVPRRWRPWKLVTADVDGDGKREIVVGVEKATRFIPRPHHCVFIYQWAEGTVAPKWLGSSLARPFEEFLFAELDGDPGAELVALETTRTGGKGIAVYSWQSFGFVGDWRRGAWTRARLDGVKAGKVLVRTPAGQLAVGR